MGLAASQGRMLLLTARKSDLEFRAQQISQKRLILAQQLEDISTEYETAASNRQMKIDLYKTTTEDGDDQRQTLEGSRNLTYAALVSSTVMNQDDDEEPCLLPCEASGTSKKQLTFTAGEKFRLVDDSGAIVVASEDEIPNIKSFTKASNGDGKYRKKDATGKVIAKYVVDPNLKANSGISTNGTTDGPNYLQECLRNGKYLIQKPSGEKDEDDKTEWRNVSWDAIGSIKDNYYQDDDDVAKSKYDRLQREVQNQDKKLELELDNVETQRNAVQTEMDSVDKVMEENVEKTFNAFG